MTDGLNIDELDISDGLKASMKQTEAVLKQRWQRDAERSSKVYSIDLPKQSVRISNELRALDALRVLKGYGIHGTYSISRKEGK